MDKTKLKQLKTKAMSGAVWTTLQALIGKAMGLGFFVLLARLLTPEIIGLVAAAAVFQVVSDLIMEQGLGQALIQRKDLQPTHCDTAFWSQITASLTVCVIGQMFAPQLAGLYNQPSLTPVIRVLLFITPLSALGAVHEALLNRELRFKQIALRNLGATAVGGGLAVILALRGAGVWSLVAQQVTVSLVGTLLLWAASKWRPGRAVSWTALRDLGKFSIHLFAQRGIGLLKNSGDQFVIGYALGVQSLGLYSTAFRTTNSVTSLFIAPFSRITLPLFSKLQDSTRELAEAYDYALRLAFMVSLPITVGMTILSHELTTVILGEKWLGTADLIAVLSWLVLARSVAAANTAILLARGLSWRRLQVSVAYVIINFTLLVLFVSRGIMFVSIIYSVCALCTLPINAWMVKAEIGYAWTAYLSALWHPLIAVAGLFGVVLSAKCFASEVSSPLMLASVVICGGLTYGGILGVISPMARALVKSGLAKLRQKSSFAH